MIKSAKSRGSIPCKLIAAFGEDSTHQIVIHSLIQQISREVNVEVNIKWRSARGGYGRVAKELKQYFRNVGYPTDSPDIVVIATDGNCKGYNERSKELSIDENSIPPVVCAIPDPHIERRLLLDSEAFKKVLGKGCKDLGYKCERHFYKNALRQACLDAEEYPYSDVMEHAEDIASKMDLNRAASKDPSLQRFLDRLRLALKGSFL